MPSATTQEEHHDNRQHDNHRIRRAGPSLRGELILPDHPEYDVARRVYNGMIDRHPAAIARCRDAADVRACVEFARDRSIELAVRGGAHNAGGLGVWDDALVIDLGAMRTVALSPVDGTVRVDPAAPGRTWTMPRWRSDSSSRLASSVPPE